MESSGEFNSRLEQMEKQLYRQGQSDLDLESTRLPTKNSAGPRGWNESLRQAEPSPRRNLTSGWLFKVFIVSLIFFLAALGVAGYMFLSGINVVSSGNIDISLQGPNIIKAGDEVNLQATITNKNQVPLNSVSLIFDYPPGTLNSLDRQTPQLVQRETVNAIEARQTVNVSSRAIVFGEQNTEQQIKITMEYRLPDSSALFTKVMFYKVMVGSPPLSVSLDFPVEVNVGRDFPLAVKIVSNSETVLKNILLTIDYPSGFSVRSANPESVGASNTWSLGDIPAGGERQINLVGVLEGQDEDVKSFRLHVGTGGSGSSSEISMEYGNVFKTINIRRPFVSIGLTANGDKSSQLVLKPGNEVRLDLQLVNNLSDKIAEGVVNIKLTGAAIDRRSVKVTNGFYDSTKDSISWDKTQTSDLAMISPGESKTLSFSFRLLDYKDQTMTSLRNPEVDLQASFNGSRLTESSAAEAISSEVEKNIKIESVPHLTARAVYYLGPFKNSGPLPPKVGQDTTYTIIWSVSNTTNGLGGMEVKTTLPPYMEWLGSISPLSEKIVYDPTNRQISWKLDQVTAGAGLTAPMREAAFQISLTPSLSQVNSVAILTSEASWAAADLFTKTNLSGSSGTLDSNLTTDPNFNYDEARVVE